MTRVCAGESEEGRKSAVYADIWQLLGKTPHLDLANTAALVLSAHRVLVNWPKMLKYQKCVDACGIRTHINLKRILAVLTIAPTRQLGFLLVQYFSKLIYKPSLNEVRSGTPAGGGRRCSGGLVPGLRPCEYGKAAQMTFSVLGNP
jgi:hypothetical protein